MGTGTEVYLYRTFHSGKCYQLGINRASASVVDHDPRARQPDWREVDGALEEARQSFRFLK